MAPEASRIAQESLNLCNNARMMIDIVLAGGGVGIFPEPMVRGEVARGALVELAGIQPADMERGAQLFQHDREVAGGDDGVEQVAPRKAQPRQRVQWVAAYPADPTRWEEFQRPGLGGPLADVRALVQAGQWGLARERLLALGAQGEGAAAIALALADLELADGQTEAAQDLAVNLPDERREHMVVEGVGHYGVFNGSRWRGSIQPRVRDFIAAQRRPVV